MQKDIFLVLILFILLACGENGGGAPGFSDSKCEGSSVGGHCWYLGAKGDNCDVTCINHGGYSQATLNYAGSGGTASQCQDVIDSLGASNGPVSDFSPCDTGSGCNLSGVGRNPFRCTLPVTISSTSYVDEERVCACNE